MQERKEVQRERGCKNTNGSMPEKKKTQPGGPGRAHLNGSACLGSPLRLGDAKRLRAAPRVPGGRPSVATPPAAHGGSHSGDAKNGPGRAPFHPPT